MVKSGRVAVGASGSRSLPAPARLLLRLLARPLDLRVPHLTTTLHLRLELALWACSLLLASASSLVLYKHSYLRVAGDWTFLLWVGAWLGRHFLLRLACTASWADPGRPSRGEHAGSWRRRRGFRSWLRKQRRGRSGAHRLRWLLRFLSPYDLASALLRLVRSCAMAGQHCDASAANGVAGAAVTGAEGELFDAHHSAKGSGGGHHGFGAHARSDDARDAVILSLARSWGTLCGLSFAVWSLLRGEGAGGMRGAVGEMLGLVGGVLWGWTAQCLSLVGLSSLLSPDGSGLGRGFGSESTLGSGGGGGGGGGGGSKRQRRKQMAQGGGGGGGRSDDASSSSRDRGVGGSGSDADRSLDFVTGKLTFCLFPAHVRSQALHVQQLRTSDMYRALGRAWEASPPSQLVVAMLATVFLIYGWLFPLGGYNRLLGLGGGTDGADYHTVESSVPNFVGHPGLQQGGGGGQIMVGAEGSVGSGYWRNQSPFPAPATFDAEAPGWVPLMFLVVSFGTAASLLLYGRILLPIPEFVAGTNVLKAIRAETRMLGGGTSTGKSAKLKDKDLPWAENYKSIAAENRLRLYTKVAIVRILENVLLCVVLPQTEVVCRITGHCESGPLLWGPTGVAGIAGRRFGKGTSFLTGSYDALSGDDFATRLIVAAVVLVTAALLAAQMTLASRTYLAIMGYISGEWELVAEEDDDDDGDSTASGSRAPSSSVRSWLSEILPAGLVGSSNAVDATPSSSSRDRQRTHSSRRAASSSSVPTTLMQWDPKRRYQKGDRIAYDDSVYVAASNSPEGPPFDPFLRAAHDLYKDELGHPSSSGVMPCLTMGCIVLASMMLSATVIWRNAGWEYRPLGLCLAASLIAGYAIAHSTERSLHGMRKTAEEIIAQTEPRPEREM